jgi:hypothetical protein
MRTSPAPSAWGCRFLKTGELSKSDVPRRSAGLGNNQEIEGGHPVADNQEPEHGSRGKRSSNHRDRRGRWKPYILKPAEVTNLVSVRTSSTKTSTSAKASQEAGRVLAVLTAVPISYWLGDC